MRKRNGSVVKNYILSFDRSVATGKLIGLVNSQMLEENIRYQDLSRVTGISISRLKEILSSNNPRLYKEEVQILCLSHGITMDNVFGLPVLDSDELVEREYAAMRKRSDALKIVHKTRVSPDVKINPIDDKRSELYLYCLRKCLHKYPTFLGIYGTN